jgi:hypothetical protein
MRATNKLYNKNTEKEKEGNQMKCPYVRNSPLKCVRMIEEGLDGKISDFDLQHFCDGNPVNCYFYRLPPLQEREKSLKQKFSAILKR